MSTDSLYLQHKGCFEPTNIPLSQRGFKIIQDKVKADILRKLTTTDTPYYFPNAITLQSPLTKLLYTLPNGNKVYSLPQDNMPCVVPDMSQYNTMAMVTPQKNQYNNMPNAANPPQSKIEPVSPEKLKELQDYLNKKSKNSN